MARRPLRLESEQQLDAIRRRDEEDEADLLTKHDWLGGEPYPKLQPTYGEVAREYGLKDPQIADPTTLILIDEADRPRMASLEQAQAIFDGSEVGIVLIGMPGIKSAWRGTHSSIPGSGSSMNSARWELQKSGGCWPNDGRQSA